MLRIFLFQVSLLCGLSAAMQNMDPSQLKKKADYLQAVRDELSFGSPKFRKLKPLLQNAGLVLGRNGKKIFVSFLSPAGEKMSVVFDDPHDVQLHKGQAADWVIELKKITSFALPK